MLNHDNILIVDDNPNNLRVLDGILHEHGYVVRPALSGEIALRAIAAVRPDLILLDIRMPGIDGYETCRRIKQQGHLRAIPVIFISALNETDDKHSAFQVGAADFITKPFQTHEVLARVQTQMDLVHARRALVQHLAQSEAAGSASTTQELRQAVQEARLDIHSIHAAIDTFAATHTTGASAAEISQFLDNIRTSTDSALRKLDNTSEPIRALVQLDGKRVRQSVES